MDQGGVGKRWRFRGEGSGSSEGSLGDGQFPGDLGVPWDVVSGRELGFS